MKVKRYKRLKSDAKIIDIDDDEKSVKETLNLVKAEWSSDSDALSDNGDDMNSETILKFRTGIYSMKKEECQVCSLDTSVLWVQVNAKYLQPLKVTVESRAIFPFIATTFGDMHLHRRFDGNVTLKLALVCGDCLYALRSNLTPKYSILNYMWVEAIPSELNDLTMAEELLCSKIIRRSVVWKSSFAHSKLNHHVVGFENHLQTIQILPLPIGHLGDLLHIVMVGLTTDTQSLGKVNLVRKAKCLAAIAWLVRNNYWYHDVQVNDTFLASDVQVNDNFLASEVYMHPINYQQRPDIEELIPEHSNFTVDPEVLRLRVSKGEIVEHFTKSGLFKSPVHGHDVETIAIEGALNTFLSHTQTGLLGSIRSDELANLDEDMRWICAAYPTLFPSGLTGPSNPKRPSTLSLKEWVNWTLRVHVKAQEHPDFVFVLYNLTQRYAAMNAIRLRVAGIPKKGLTPAIIAEQLVRVKERKGVDDENVRTLLRQTRSVGALLPHTPHRKTIIRSNLSGLMIRYGSPAFFLTLNPNDLHSPILAMRTCTRNETKLEGLFSNGALSPPLLINQNPVDCAKYFNDIVQKFLECGLGWNNQTMTYNKSIFGKVLAHIGVVEEQQRKQLHLHALIWVQGLTDYDKFDASMVSQEYQAKILRYLKPLVSTVLHHCSIKSTEDQDARLYLYPEHADFDSQLGWVQRSAQMHKCSTFYCKKTGTGCRFKYPKALVEHSYYDSKAKRLMLQRNNMFLNACIPFVAVVGRFNTDIQFLPGNGRGARARSVAHYISDYSTKSEASNLHLLEYMSTKLKSMEQYDADRLEQTLHKPTGLFSSLLTKTVAKFAGAKDVGSVEAASCLLGYPDHYSSKQFDPLNWKRWDLWVCRTLGQRYNGHTYTRLEDSVIGDYHSVLQSSLSQGDMIELASSHLIWDEKNTYLFRHKELAQLCLYEIHSLYRVCKTTRENEPDGFYQIRYPFKTVLYGHVKRTCTAVVTLPWFSAKSPIHGYKTENYARLLLVLFKPFVTVDDLFTDGYNFCSLLEKWKLTIDITEKPYTFLYNIEVDSFVAKDSLTEKTRKSCRDLIENEALIPMKDDGERITWTRVDYHLAPSTQFDEKTIDNLDVMKLIQKSQRAMVRSSHTTQLEMNPIILNIEHDSGQNISMAIRNILVAERTEQTCNKQWAIVRYFARHVLDTTRHRLGERWQGEREPLQMMVLGAGGTGKSWIINVMKKILEACRIHFTLAAPTGKAAINIGGDTIDSIFSFQSRKGTCLLGYTYPLDFNLQAFDTLPLNSPLRHTKYLLVDEISMVSKQYLHRMNTKLCAVRTKGQDMPLGGINYIFFGDFMQFAPVAGTSLISEVYSNNTIGADLVMKSVTILIELTKQKRQTDASYLSVLTNIRKGCVSQSDYEFLTKHCKLPPLNTIPIERLLQTDVIVSLNSVRLNWNRDLSKRFSEFHDTNRYVLQANDMVKYEVVTGPIKDALKNASGLSPALQHVLYLSKGTPVTFLENTWKELGIVNGTSGVLFDLKRISNGEVMYLDIHFPETMPFQVEGLLSNHLLIAKVRVSSSITLADGTVICFTREQFPIQEGFATTDYKKQGSTCKYAIIDVRRGKGTKSVSTYVKLSRTKSAESTYIVDGFTKEDLLIEKPSGYHNLQKLINRGWDLFHASIRSNPSLIFDM